MAKRKLNEEEGFGLRTPARRETGKRKRADDEPRSKSKSGKRRAARDTGKRQAVGDSGKRQAAKDTGKRKAVEDSGKRKAVEGSGKRKAVEKEAAPPPPAPDGGGKALPLVLGALVAGVVGGVVVFLMQAPEAKEPERAGVVQAPPPGRPSAGPRDVQARPAAQESAVALERSPAALGTGEEPVVPDDLVAPEGAGVPDLSTLEELAGRSPSHAEIARILEEYGDVFRVDLAGDNRLFQDFLEREKREQELIDRIRQLGPLAVDAITDMILGVDNRAQQIFLSKAISGMEGREALAAVGSLLGEVKDVAVQTTLVRFLPETPEAAAAVSAAYASEDSSNLRTMLLREYHRRVGDDDAAGAELFREAALNDPDANVRAEAVTIIGRRGDPSDQGLMEEIIRGESNLQIRQRAIVAYAETGGQQSLDYLENLARDPEAGLPVRASAVLAIGRVGGDQAIASLDLLAQTDPDQEIRTRANRLAQSLRARQQAENDPSAPSPVDEDPMRLSGPPAGPLDRR